MDNSQNIIKMKKLIIVALCTITLLSCTDSNGTKDVLIKSGYTPLNVGGYRWFGGDKSDFYHTNFKAISPHGDTVTGYVTKGLLFKGKTIRLD